MECHLSELVPEGPVMDDLAYTPCEEYGHRFRYNDNGTEEFSSCLDCGEQHS